ncbi:Na+/H+ antiporter NhaC [Marinoscillum sp. MHG1-6]|uniref:Na+/H+ antiporter NhaC n=1 Tax=Marinoscillum sp. MHG1-6 TaxID=2959627 RepID=UPI002157C436|nr:Na+/H+ antiporter NhaC [Marinoscillum sp. MHG1-6]
MATERSEPNLIQSFIPIIFLIVALSINVGLFGDAALDGSNQIILILSATVATGVALKIGFKWKEIESGILKSINSAMASILILLFIGSLAGTWLLSGVVPAMIYYGLQILNPSIFLFASCIVCSVVSLATGSSWTTAATVGIALMGIGKALGISEGLIAGSILSGAYFGDKMSPLSDTTNLAPAMAGTDLFTHIRYMTITTIPSISITLIIFLFIGFNLDSSGSINATADILQAIDDKFYISPWLFIVPAVVVILIVKKIPALPAILIGTILASIFAMIFQKDMVMDVASEQVTAYGFLLDRLSSAFPIFTGLFLGTVQSLFGDVNITTSNELVNELLSSGGMKGMLGTIWLIISAMIFGGVMEGSGMLKTIASSIIRLVNSTGALIASTAGTCVFFNITASDQYLAIVVPGRMYSDIYQRKGLAPENLSRTLEDSGTVTSVLVPWNTCGAYHSQVLSVSTFTFAPYCFFNIISPLMTILIGTIGYKVKKLTKKEPEVA